MGHATWLAACALGIVGLSSSAQAQRSCPIYSKPAAVYDWLDNYWGDQFRIAGQAYHSPQIQMSPDGLPFVVTPGNGSQPTENVVLYKSLALLPDDLDFRLLKYFSFRSKPWSWIQYDQFYYDTLVAAVGDAFGPVPALAHEFSHHVQNVGRRSSLLPQGPDDPHATDTRSSKDIKARELDADRMAGAAVAAMIRSAASAGSTRSTQKCYEVAIAELASHHDALHGSSAEREACFHYGYVHGPAPFYYSEPAGTFLDGNYQYGGNEKVDCGDITQMVGQIVMNTGTRRDNMGDLYATAQRIRIIISSITLNGMHIGPQQISPNGFYTQAEGVFHEIASGNYFELQALYDRHGRQYATDQMIRLHNCATSTVC